jgi:aryl-alcohol dehydrogenase-like predicted oxidoreductase
MARPTARPVTGWLEAGELRIGLGCMRMSAEELRDTIPAAVSAGITVFDTARAYGDNERLLADALRECGAVTRARVVTKGGMSRDGGRWIPDGRAKSIVTDCEASLTALGGLPIDTYLIHAPDPRTPWSTSVRALARLVDQGVVPRVGISNVSRRQLDEALELAPIAAVEVALSASDDRALRGGVVDRCTELGIALIAHSPLGGPKRARGIEPGEAEIALARLLALSPVVVPIPGARRPETARSAARAAMVAPGVVERAARARPGRIREGEIVVVMGIPGAGKSRVAAELVARDYVRLNRDERGGSMRELGEALDDALASGASRLVLDNTYLTRASRSYVIESAARHRLAARAVWLDTPLAQAQVNLVERLLERFGSLPDPEQLRTLARRVPGLLAPTSQMRALRELEPPSPDEGWAAVERIEFVRTPPAGAVGGGVFVAAAAVERPELLAQGDLEAPHLVFDWNEAGDRERLERSLAIVASEVAGPVEGALCPHPAGPPTCWCRPPLPGLPLAFARARRRDPSRSVVIGTGPAHRTLATTLGARYVDAS